MGSSSTSNGGNKSQTQSTNTGQPSWSSGATANSSYGTGTGATGNSTASTGPEPGSDAYNSMNTQLQTSPMQSLVNLFNQGGMGNVMNSVMSNLYNSSGSNSTMDEAANAFRQLGTTGTQNYQNIYDKAGQAGANEKYLTDYASGKYVGASNPYTDAIVQKSQDEAGSGVNRMFAAGGRYGGGVNQGTLADSYQTIGNQYRGDQYNKDVANQLSAAGAISGEQQGRLGLQNTAAGGVGGLQSTAAGGLGSLGTSAMQNWLNSQNAASNIQNQGIQNQLSGMGQLSNVQNNKMYDSNTQQSVGKTVDDETQQQLSDLINQWSQGDMSSWSKLGGLLSAASGSAGNYGTSSGSTTQKQNSGWGSILGGLLSLL